MAELKEMGIDAKPMHCQSLCPHAPLVRVDGCFIHNATLEKVSEALGDGG